MFFIAASYMCFNHDITKYKSWHHDNTIMLSWYGDSIKLKCEENKNVINSSVTNCVSWSSGKSLAHDAGDRSSNPKHYL